MILILKNAHCNRTLRKLVTFVVFLIYELQLRKTNACENKELNSFKNEKTT